MRILKWGNPLERHVTKVKRVTPARRTPSHRGLTYGLSSLLLRGRHVAGVGATSGVDLLAVKDVHVPIAPAAALTRRVQQVKWADAIASERQVRADVGEESNAHAARSGRCRAALVSAAFGAAIALSWMGCGR